MNLTANNRQSRGMKVISVILAIILIIPLIPYKAHAITKHSVGQDAVDLIKSTEGFRSTKYWDYSQWSIGYGTRCEEDEFPNGITEAEAEERLRSFASTFADYVNDFAEQYNIELTQNQFDALICMTYALGPGLWTPKGYGEFDLKTYLINGSEKYSFLQIARAFGEWRKAGGEVLQGLVKRRQLETQLFLKNRTDPTSEVWRVNTEGGLNLRAGASTSSEKTGSIVYNYIFAISEVVTGSDGSLWGKINYENKDHWVSLEYCSKIVGGPLPIDGKAQPAVTTTASGQTVSEVWKITSKDGVRLRSGPGLSYNQIGLVTYNTQITVTSTVSSEGYLWGNTILNGVKGWCVLDYATRVSTQKLPGVTLSSIYISSKPEKLSYAEGENIDLTGLKVKAVYSDKSEKEVPEDEYEVKGFESKEGKQTITVLYKKLTATFTVTVTGKKLVNIEVYTAPTKTMYKTGEGLSIKGLQVKGVYSNNTTEMLKKYYLEGVDGFSATPGKKTITVNVDDLTAEFEVEVTEKTLTGIEIESPPTKTEYIVGQEFDPEGLVVNGLFDNGRKIPLESYSMMGFTLDTAGEKKMTINYNGFKADFTINVTEPSEYDLPGDLDGNGERTIFDLVILNKIIDGEDTDYDKDRAYLADVNGDGTVDQKDVDMLSGIVSDQ